MNEIIKQREHYQNTAHLYDSINEWKLFSEHFMACTFLSGFITELNIKSILDVGSGTGSAIVMLKKRFPELKIVGVEPVTELREEGYKKGLSEQELIAGDANNLEFETGEFDLVCEFSMLHHVSNPDRIVAELLRVSKKAVFISDSNTYGMGSFSRRLLKQFLRISQLWQIFEYIRTKGKGYYELEGDGISYSYSVFKNYDQIQNECSRVYTLDTARENAKGVNPYFNASHVAILGIK